MSLLSDAVRYACYAEQERLLSYLPLSHVAGYMVDIISPVFCTANKPAWSTTYFARPYDLREKTIRDRLCVVKPTIFLGVPLVWEKVADTVRAVGAQVCCADHGSLVGRFGFGRVDPVLPSSLYGDRLRHLGSGAFGLQATCDV